MPPVRVSYNAESVVLGLRDVRAAVQSLPQRISTNIVLRGLREAGAVIRDEARRLAPVRNSSHGGRLKRNIWSDSRGVFRDNTRVPNQHRAQVYIRQPRDGRRSVRTYAHFVEFGTAPHAIGRGSIRKQFARSNRQVRQVGGRHPGARARPFLGPAFETKKFAALQAMADRIRKDVALEVAGIRTGRAAGGLRRAG